MEIKVKYYQTYINERCMKIPTEQLLDIIDELAQNAKFYMSSDLDSTMTEKVNAAIVDLLKNQKYRYLPLYLVAEAFTKGALGELGGTTRFTVRNVVIWLNQMSDRMAQIEMERKSKEDDARRKAAEDGFKLSKDRSSLFGAACLLKASWQLQDPDYDLCTLDKIVDLIERGYKLSQIHPSMILK
jgi:hypothetical protein